MVTRRAAGPHFRGAFSPHRAHVREHRGVQWFSTCVCHHLRLLWMAHAGGYGWQWEGVQIAGAAGAQGPAAAATAWACALGFCTAVHVGVHVRAETPIHIDIALSCCALPRVDAVMITVMSTFTWPLAIGVAACSEYHTCTPPCRWCGRHWVRPYTRTLIDDAAKSHHYARICTFPQPAGLW